MTASQKQRKAKAQSIAVILCAGQGTRMGATRNKVFLPLLGKPLLIHTIETFIKARTVDEIFLVGHPREIPYLTTEVVAHYALRKIGGIIPGGATRHQSEYAALNALRGRIEAATIDVVLIHDGARPFVADADIRDVIRAAREVGGALLAAPVQADETIARTDASGQILTFYPAPELWRAQTPQVFAAQLLLAAYDAAQNDHFEGTDTSATFERAGHAVCVIPGQETNIKVTVPARSGSRRAIDLAAKRAERVIHPRHCSLPGDL